MSRFAHRLLQSVQSPGTSFVPGAPLCLWPTNPTPVLADAADAQAVEVGLKFMSAVSTRVTGVRFYKSAANTGQHIGSLWQTNGTKLASVTFTGESASGWQQQLFASPIDITANTTYVISYHCANGHYSSDDGYFTSSSYVNEIVTAPASTLSANGVYAYSASTIFPNLSYDDTNYWVDVIVENKAVPNSPPVISQFTASPSSISQASSTTLSWFVGGTQPMQLSIDQAVGTVTGMSMIVAPAATTTYTLTATNSFGTTTAQTSVSVVPVGSIPMVVDGAMTYQTIDGVGTNINSLSWNNDNSATAIDMLADDMGQTIWRVVFDMMDWETTNDNSDPATPDWTYYNALYSNTKFQNLWGTLGYLNQKGFDATIALSLMGDVPSWMGGSTITDAMEDEAVEMITTMVYYARNTAGVRFGMLDPFNEGDGTSNEGPTVSPAKYVRLVSKISARLDAMGLSDIHFLGPNIGTPSTGVNSYFPAIMANSAIMNKLDHFAVHSYYADSGGAYAKIQGSSYANRNFWMTEYANPYDAFSLLDQYTSALLVWEGFDSVYNHAILNGLGSQPGNDDVGHVPIAYNKATKTYTRRKEFYQDKQLFKFLTPGSVRVDTSGTINAYAFYHAPTQRVTVVAYNNGGSAQVVAGSLKNLPTVTNLHYYKTDATNNFTQTPDITVAGGNFQFSIPAGGIVTLTSL